MKFRWEIYIKRNILYCEISQVYKNEKVKWTVKDIVYLSEDVQSSTG